MNPINRKQYDKGRIRGKNRIPSACYAPFTSLYFDPLGNVTPCCQTQRSGFRLGNVSETGLDRIWNGEALGELRRSLAAYSFPAACGFCDWQVRQGNLRGVFAKVFDEYPAGDLEPLWPVVMEFALSNRCNFECVMCDGWYSSLIRERRDRLPPLPHVYGDAFFAQLEKYLPHLECARFFGGEPFLMEENQRVWEALMKLGGARRPRVQITTNGSIWNDRVARVLGSLAPDIVISLDGFSKETLEKIRVGASHEKIRENVRRFREEVDRSGGSLNFAFCLMRQNWHEFADFLRFAEDLESEVFVNTVTDPESCSLYALPPGEIEEIVARLEEEGGKIARGLKRNRAVWKDALASLRGDAAARREGNERR